MSIFRLRLILTITSLAIVVIHMIYPKILFDGTTLVLLIIAAVPWLAPVIKSLELPGGFKIEMQDIQSATSKVLINTKTEEKQLDPDLKLQREHKSTNIVLRQQDAKGSLERLRAVGYTDPSIALVLLRIEIEKYLREMADLVGFEQDKGSIKSVLKSLELGGFIPSTLASGLGELIQLGNRAAHGVEVSPKASKWAFVEAQAILEAMYKFPIVWEAFFPFDKRMVKEPAEDPRLKPYSKYVSSGQNRMGRWFVVKRNPSTGESILILFQNPDDDS